MDPTIELGPDDSSAELHLCPWNLTPGSDLAPGTALWACTRTPQTRRTTVAPCVDPPCLAASLEVAEAALESALQQLRFIIELTDLDEVDFYRAFSRSKFERMSGGAELLRSSLAQARRALVGAAALFTPGGSNPDGDPPLPVETAARAVGVLSLHRLLVDYARARGLRYTPVATTPCTERRCPLCLEAPLPADLACQPRVRRPCAPGALRELLERAGALSTALVSTLTSALGAPLPATPPRVLDLGEDVARYEGTCRPLAARFATDMARFTALCDEMVALVTLDAAPVVSPDFQRTLALQERLAGFAPLWVVCGDRVLGLERRLQLVPAPRSLAQTLRRP